MDVESEWLEADGLGGFASGTDRIRRGRRYHALLLSATTPPTGRMVLVNGIEAFVTTDAGPVALSSQRYVPNVVHPDGERHLEEFTTTPWPTWSYRLPDGAQVRFELLCPRGVAATVLRWSLPKGAKSLTTLTVRLLLSGRDYHALHRENSLCRTESAIDDHCVRWRPYDGVPEIAAWHSGRFTPEPLWFRQFYYQQEAERGLDCTEDLWSPGILRFQLGGAPAVCVLTSDAPHGWTLEEDTDLLSAVEALAEAERRGRSGLPDRPARSARDYIVRRGNGKTIIAGYPWFTDWGRDTFIALRGLCLATGQISDAGEILRTWSRTISQGMLPNHFPDRGERPEYTSVDASLWFVIAAHDYLDTLSAAGVAPPFDHDLLPAAIEAVLSGYLQGASFNIHVDHDGLLAAGSPDMQLTWMDARVRGQVVTPRSGKPVEVQALWVNALWIASKFSPRWRSHFTRAYDSFRQRFWNERTGCLFDVIDVDHQSGEMDASIRPNQILAVGGLPLNLLDDPAARSVVNVVEERLWTPMGLRTLDPAAAAYRPFYTGGADDRDAAYHQGTAWPWLLGPFVEAWVRTRGATPEAAQAAEKFLAPLEAHLAEAGLGHISEIADAEPRLRTGPRQQAPRGCPFQAWSLGEWLRLRRLLHGLSSGSGATPVKAEDARPC